MSYNSPKFTLIDDLPDLEDLEGPHGGGMGPPPPHGMMGPPPPHGMKGGFSHGEVNGPPMINTGKYLKNNKREISPQSGMGPENHRMRQGMMDGDGYDVGGFTPAENNLVTYDMPNGSPSCIDVAEHIANCPICSKFYNNDKTVYLLAIAALVIICILLANKCLHSK